MNNEPNFTEALHYILTLGPDEAVKRLKGVQGPERRLVGDTAERPQPDDAEARSGEGSDVGETAVAKPCRCSFTHRLYCVRKTRWTFCPACGGKIDRDERSGFSNA
jgi:hypothetical protein